MRRRDKLRFALRGPKDPASTPLNATTSSTSLTGQIASSSQTKQNNVSATVVPAPAAAFSTIIDQNQALQKAIEQYITTIPPQEKRCSLTAAHNITDDNVLDSVCSQNQQHRDQSSFRPHSTSISRFLQGIGHFTDAIAIGIQANPDVSSIVVGLARGLITVAIDFASFFDKLTELMGRMTDYLSPFADYAKSARHFPTVETSLVAVYVDLLTFLRSARTVFIDKQGNTRTWTSWRVFWRVQWIPFQEEFGTIEASMQHHCQVLHHAAQAGNLEKSMELSEAEWRRRQRETGQYLPKC